MANSAYLQSTDYAVYGVPNATASQVTLASNIIDSYLYRPEGLIWAPDANGNPCYMTSLAASYTLTLAESISPGSNVVVTVSGPVNAIALGSTQSGLVGIIDRTNTNATEACIVNAINGNTITLSKVQFAHASGAQMEFGMVILEEMQMPNNRPLKNLSRTPVRMVVGAQGRYGYGRRGNTTNDINAFNLLAIYTTFGGPPSWEIFDQTLVGVDPNTGQVWAPAGIFLAYYTEIRFQYIAGWTYASLPNAIKQACANIITASTNAPLFGSVTRQQAGDTSIMRNKPTNLDDDTKALLEPFRARVAF